MLDMLKQLMWRLAREEHGQTMVEYGLILTFISLVAIGVLTQMGTSVIGVFTSAAAGF